MAELLGPSRIAIILMVAGTALIGWGFGRPTCPALPFSVFDAANVIDCGGPNPLLMLLIYASAGGAMFVAGVLLALRPRPAAKAR